MTDHLFVYGTLRSEFPHPLSRRLQAKAKLIGAGSAPGVLYAFDRYPGAMFDAKAKSPVFGEVYTLAVSQGLLAELDAYESVVDPGTPPFRRVAIKVRLEKGGTLEAWTYELTAKPQWARRVPGGDYMHYLRSIANRPRRS